MLIPRKMWLLANLTGRGAPAVTDSLLLCPFVWSRLLWEGVVVLPERPVGGRGSGDHDWVRTDPSQGARNVIESGEYFALSRPDESVPRSGSLDFLAGEALFFQRHLQTKLVFSNLYTHSSMFALWNGVSASERYSREVFPTTYLS